MARARTGTGLTEDQISTLREALTNNRRPRIALPGNQFGDDAHGQVVAVGDPAADGDEFISVRVKLAGISDTLQFSPEELTLPDKASRSKTAAQAAAPRRRQPRAAPISTANSSMPGTPPAPKAPGKRRPPASVTFTVSSSGHAWTLSATRGGRSLMKATTVSAGVIAATAALFADAALREAVADINEVALAEAEERAEALRTELAAVESIVQSHQRPGS